MRFGALLSRCARRVRGACLLGFGSAGCGEAVLDGGSARGALTSVGEASGVAYRSLDGHPGCTTAGLSYSPASIPGYRCAAKEIAPAGGDARRPLVLLVHGNSASPRDFEAFEPASSRPMLGERLAVEGYHALAVDLRVDRSDDPSGDEDTGNPSRNVDHGWATPIVEHFLASALAAFPSRPVSIVAFSFGVTATRDALERLHASGARPFERLSDVVFAAGANHGCSTYRARCGKNPTMRGRVSCELGDRERFLPTRFLGRLNGPDGAFELPCADGDSAFGQAGACGGHAVAYTTIVMNEMTPDSQQDEFVSVPSARLGDRPDVNRLIGLGDADDTGYFYGGIYKNHYGAIRSEAGIRIVLAALAD